MTTDPGAEGREYDKGFDAGWAEATAARLEGKRDQLAQVIEEYMGRGTEFRAYDLADRILRHLTPPLDLT